MSPKASFLRPLFKAPILIKKWLLLGISLCYRIFAMLILWTTDPFGEFGWRHTQCFSFRNRSCPNRMWRKHFSVMPAYLRTWQIHLDSVHAFIAEWASIWLNNNWLWFDFSRYGFARKICLSDVSKTQILLSSWKHWNSNTGKGLFALLVLVGLITLKQNFLSNFV